MWNNLNEKQRMRNQFNIFINPFEDLSELILLPIAIISTLLISWYASVYGIAFEGAIGARSGHEVSFLQSLYANTSAIFLISLCYYGYALLRKLPIRLIDVIVVCATARIILYLITLSMGMSFVENTEARVDEALLVGDLTLSRLARIDLLLITLYSLLLITLLVYYIYFLIKGLRYISNSKNKLDGLVIICILIFAQLIL